MSTPHYVTTNRSQFRVWSSGIGPCVVVIAGLAEGAEQISRRLSQDLPDRRVLVLDIAGLGYPDVPAADPIESAQLLAECLELLVNEPYTLVSWDLSAALLPSLIDAAETKPYQTILVGYDRAQKWRKSGINAPYFHPLTDGAHLISLWSFLRDRSILDPEDPRMPSSEFCAPLGNPDLSPTFVAAATRPIWFSDLWNYCINNIDSAGHIGSADIVEFASSLPAVVRRPSGQSINKLSPPAPSAREGRLWHEYVETKFGRAHLRRAGVKGDPVMVLPTGGGSSAQFGPVVEGFGKNRRAFSVDYFGNGLSDGGARIVDAVQLAREAVSVLDALGIDKVDLWGSHTGACVAIEIAINFPDRVNKVILEGPVVISPEFRSDLLEKYFLDFAPDPWGLHIQKIWNWRRDMFLYWPWYEVSPGSARQLGLPTPQSLHDYAVGILESGDSYGDAYRAGIGYDTTVRLPLLSHRTLITAGPNDMLGNALTDAVEALGRDSPVTVAPTPTTMWWPDPDPEEARETLNIYLDFLDSNGPA